MEHIKEEVDQVSYVVKVNGVAISTPTSRALAEQQKNNLPEESRLLAEVVPVTSDGNQILFG